MILYLVLKLFDSLLYCLISTIPVFETPAWLVTQLPDVMTRIAAFNWFLPISETVLVVLFLITFTLSYKLMKIVLGVVHIDLNK